MSRHLQFRLDCNLNSEDARILIRDGALLFAELKMTDEAELYLKWHPKLAKVIEKW